MVALHIDKASLLSSPLWRGSGSLMTWYFLLAAHLYQLLHQVLFVSQLAVRLHVLSQEQGPSVGGIANDAHEKLSVLDQVNLLDVNGGGMSRGEASATVVTFEQHLVHTDVVAEGSPRLEGFGAVAASVRPLSLMLAHLVVSEGTVCFERRVAQRTLVWPLIRMRAHVEGEQVGQSESFRAQRACMSFGAFVDELVFASIARSAESFRTVLASKCF
jgi:hypothetical protein